MKECFLSFGSAFTVPVAMEALEDVLEIDLPKAVLVVLDVLEIFDLVSLDDDFALD